MLVNTVWNLTFFLYFSPQTGDFLNMKSVITISWNMNEHLAIFFSLFFLPTVKNLDLLFSSQSLPLPPCVWKSNVMERWIVDWQMPLCLLIVMSGSFPTLVLNLKLNYLIEFLLLHLAIVSSDTLSCTSSSSSAAAVSSVCSLQKIWNSHYK